MPAKIKVFSAVVEPPLPEAGIFTWNIASDLVFADPAVAALFGLDPDETTTGLPMQRYLDRIHPDDRPQLAKTISNGIIAQIPQQSVYRVLSADDDQYRSVAAFCRAFRDRGGIPVLYSGMVVPA